MAAELQTQRALKISRPGVLELTESSPVPRPEADEVLVRVIYVALNPVDSKSTDLSPTLGATIGCDFAGEGSVQPSSVLASMN
jgi:aspyridone synthetase trans-acting enoyl reductase